MLFLVMHNQRYQDLIRISIPGCEHSDGIIGYKYSHDGYFKGGGIIDGDSATNILDCANQCTLNTACDAFQHRNNGQCFLYIDNDLQDKGYFTDGTDSAYIKSTGIQRV